MFVRLIATTLLLIASSSLPAETERSTFTATAVTSLSNRVLVDTYKWNREKKAYMCGSKSGGLVQTNAKGEQVLLGGWCIGNLQFSGAVTIKKEGIELGKGTTMLYPQSAPAKK